VKVVAMLGALAAVGLTAAEIVAILAMIGYALNELDALYGGRGIDIHYSGSVGVIIGAPTVARQSGVWVAQDFLSPATSCSSVVDCLTIQAELIGLR
jgi:hypothetical protein